MCTKVLKNVFLGWYLACFQQSYKMCLDKYYRMVSLRFYTDTVVLSSRVSKFKNFIKWPVLTQDNRAKIARRPRKLEK